MTTANGGQTLTSDRLLLVEGKDEVNLTNSMLCRWNIGGVQVVNVGGRYQFQDRLDALLSQARARRLQLSALGVLRDADDSPQSALQSVTGALHSVSLPAPNSQGAFMRGAPSVGIFILPDGESRGSVEGLCWASVKDTPAAQCSTSYLKCLEDSEALKSRNTSKTLVHAYLAAQEDPYARVGEGALKGYWPIDHPVFDPLKRFVCRLAVI